MDRETVVSHILDLGVAGGLFAILMMFWRLLRGTDEKTIHELAVRVTEAEKRLTAIEVHHASLNASFDSHLETSAIFVAETMQALNPGRNKKG